MTDSILNTIKEMLGYPAEYTEFDLQIVMHINSVMADLSQLGVGPKGGFFISGDTEKWSDFINDNELNAVRSYIHIRVALLFDPPTNSSVLAAYERQAKEWEWRLNVAAETPDTPPVPPND